MSFNYLDNLKRVNILNNKFKTHKVQLYIRGHSIIPHGYFFVGTVPTQIQAIDSNGFNLDRLNKFSELQGTSKRSQRIKGKKKRSSIRSASRQMSRRQCIFYRQGGCNLFLLSFSTINVMFSSKNKNNKYHIFHLKFQTLFSSFFSFVI